MTVRSAKLSQLIRNLSLVTEREAWPEGTIRTWGTPPNDYQVKKTGKKWVRVVGNRDGGAEKPDDPPNRPDTGDDSKSDTSAGPVEKRRSEKTSRAVSSILRGDLRSAGYDIADELRNRGLRDADPPNSGKISSSADEYLAAVNADGKEINADAERSWNGDITLSNKYTRELTNYFKQSRSSNTYEEMGRGKAVVGLVHEILHGFTPATSSAYEGVGAKIEEVSTEMAARELAEDMFGVEDPKSLGNYPHIIDSAVAAAQKLLMEEGAEHDHTKAYHRAYRLIKKTSLRYKKRQNRLTTQSQVSVMFSEDLASELQAETGKKFSVLRTESVLNDFLHSTDL